MWGVPVGRGFFGREAELQLLAAAYGKAAAGDAQTAVVSAASGMGRTALLGEVAAQAAAAGATVLRASGDEDEADLTLGVVDQLLTAGGQPRAANSAPFAAGEELVTAWGDLAATTPLVVMVDDAHWADEPSLQALSFALRRLGRTRLLTIVACRVDEVTRLPGGLVRLADGPTGVQVRLDGLDPEAFAAVVAAAAAPLSASALLRLRAHTEGNPLHVLTLLRDLEADELMGDVTRPLRAPRSIAPIILARVAALSPEADGLVVAAAVLGVACPLAAAARLAGLEDASAALAEAQQADLLERPPEGGASIRFTHSATRSAVYYDIGPERAAGLHLAAADLVGDERDALRHRLRGTLEPDEALAATVDAAAHTLAEGGAWEEAAAWLSAALPVSSEESREGRALTAAMYRWYAGGAVPSPMTSEPAAGTDHPLGLLIDGMTAAAESRYGEAELVLRTAWERIDPTTDVELASRIAMRMADTMQGQLRSEEGLAWARRAVEVLPVGYALLGEDPLTDLVFGLVTNGLTAEATALVAERVPNAFEGARAAPGLLARGFVRLYEDDPVAAVDDLSDAADRYLRVGPPHKYIEAQALLIDANYRMGHWDFAARHAAEALTAARERAIPQLTALVLAVSIGTAAGRGLWERAAAAHAEALEQLALRGSYQALGLTWLGGARIAAARGDHQGVCDALSTIAAVADAVPEAGSDALVPWRMLYGVALVRLGRVDEAVLHSERLTSQATDANLPSVSARAARLRGVIAAGHGDVALATRELHHAATLFAAIPMPFEAAQAELDLGAELRRAGQRREAAATLKSARATFGRLDAAPFSERCDAEIASCGLRGQRRRPAGDATGLTTAELTVARLVAAGRSNREVAAELSLSVRTVEHHLSRIYAKLEVGSRSQLAARFRSSDFKP